jgi:hypothetical protein
MSDSLRCVIVGPGRRRNGLGPFFAQYLAEAGIEVCAGVGRDAERTRAACSELAHVAGTTVMASTDLSAAIRATGASVVVIAAPSATHAEHLDVAASHDVDVLCEKPLLGAGMPGADACVDRLVESFVGRGRFLVENCQWPMVLPAFETLAERGAVHPQRVAMRLSPSESGRAMLEDSASHLISVLQELLGDDGVWRLTDISIDAPSPEAMDLTCVAMPARGACEVAFELRRVRAQPRPAWLMVDGFRSDRVIEPSTYAMRLRAEDGREVPLEDPLRALVYGFAADLRARDLDCLRTHAHRIRSRARLYADLVAAWPTPR